MTKQAFIDLIKPFINPRRTGRGKSMIVGFGLGFFLGVIGVGLYLRSLTQLALSLIGVILLMPFENLAFGLLPGIFCGAWVVAKIKLDNRVDPQEATPNADIASSEPGIQPTSGTTAA